MENARQQVDRLAGLLFRKIAEYQLTYAILASCAAPTYFDPVKHGEEMLVDGGLWANNPSVIALTEALSKFKKTVEQVRILSIGTGHYANVYSQKDHWGLFTGWGHKKLVDYIFRLNSESPSNIAKLLLGDGYLRLDPTIEPWDLDDTKHLENLRAFARRDFTEQSEAIFKHMKTQR